MSAVKYRPIGDIWWLARCKYKGGVKRYGGYLGGFPERARVLLGAGINDPVLHVCGGLANLYPYAGGYGPKDARLDLDPSVQPEHLQDARQPLPEGFRAHLTDPPYSEIDATKYAPGPDMYPSPNLLVANSILSLPMGGRVGIIHYVVPACPKNARFIAMVGVACGFNNRIRAFSVYERTV